MMRKIRKKQRKIKMRGFILKLIQKIKISNNKAQAKSMKRISKINIIKVKKLLKYQKKKIN